jgi:hypothetical protein
MEAELLVKQIQDKVSQEIETKGFAKDSEIKELITKQSGALDALKLELIEKSKEIDSLKENANDITTKDMPLATEVKAFSEKVIDSMKTKEKLGELTLKATVVPGNIGTRTDYAQWIDNGTTKKPVRAPFMRSVFRSKPMNTEYLKYREENVVTRDAKVVVQCAPSTSLSNLTWITRTEQIAKVTDKIDICLDATSDYAWVESEIYSLVNESVFLKEDEEMFLGIGGANQYNSLSAISSEFVAANPLANFATSIKAPTIGDLAGVMASQIYTFGAQRAWRADYLVMNETDRIKYLHAKDANNNYLFPTFVFGQSDMIAGLKVVVNPLVAPNTMYVFDSTKGAIYQSGAIRTSTSLENRDNIETDTATIVAILRSQFVVKNIEKNAFMKCSDIDLALTAITKV